MMLPLDRLEPLALEVRAALPQPPADFDAQRRRLARDPRARIGGGSSAALWLALLGVAAAALVLVGTWRTLRAPQTAATTQSVAMATASGHRDADGSFVALEPGGLGRVLSNEQKDLRFELVRGLARVSVVPAVGHHWSVAAGPYTVNVIGTAFQVDFVPPSGLRVVVDHGIVSVAGGTLGAPIRLEAGARMHVEGDKVEVEHATDGALPAEASAPSDAVSPPAPGETVERKPGEDWESRYTASDYRKAVALARAAGFEGLVASLSEAKLVKLADAARLGGDEPGARLALQALQRRFPGGASATRATFLLGTLEARSGNAAGAIASFQRYLASAPSGAFASEATGRLMQLYAGRGQSQDAKRMAESYLKREPHGPYVRLAQSLTKAP